MAIKNWTVTTQQIKGGIEGFQNHTDYLLKMSHPNHHKTEQILEIGGDPESIEIEYHDLADKRLKAKKGGRPTQNLATSFVLSLPAEMKPTPDQWKGIYSDVIADLAVLLGVDPETLSKRSYAVLHDEAEGKHSHIHLLVSNIIDCEFKKSLTQKKATVQVKKSFNKSVLHRLRKSTRTYEKKTNNPPKNNKKKNPAWASRLNNAKKAEADAKSKAEYAKKEQEKAEKLKQETDDYQKKKFAELEAEKNRIRNGYRVAKEKEQMAEEQEKMVEKSIAEMEERSKKLDSQVKKATLYLKEFISSVNTYLFTARAVKKAKAERDAQKRIDDTKKLKEEQIKSHTLKAMNDYTKGLGGPKFKW